MEEQLINFEAAKLAKEKGFDWETLWYYTNKASTKDGREKNYNKKAAHWTSQPTQSLLQRWLREEHKLNIIIFPAMSQTKWFYGVNLVEWRDCSWENNYKTYEEALEVGLQEALKLIKEEE